MSNWYTTRENVKGAMDAAAGRDIDRQIDRLIPQVSRSVDSILRTWLIPRTETRILPYSRRWVKGRRLFFDADLISLTSLKDRGGERTLTEGTHFILQPENLGPPYSWAEILTSQALGFEAGATTPQQSFEITGQWATWSDTRDAGELGAAIADTTATSAQVKDGSLVGVGSTLLIETEQLFVSGRDSIDLGVNLAADLAADDSEETVTLGDPADDLQEGEVIRIGSERMLVTDVDSATSVQVERAHDGTTLAAHSSGADIYVFRRYAVERGVNGTTAAAHLDDTAISAYVAPPEIEQLVDAEVIAAFMQGRSGWGRTAGGERQIELSGRALKDLRGRTMGAYRRHAMVPIGGA